MKKIVTFVLLLIAMPVFAHPGHGTSPLSDGLLHPLTGLDHLLMLLGTGLLAGWSGRTLAVPAATLMAMVGGALLGYLLGDVTGVQSLIFASLLALCAGVLLPQRRAMLVLAMPVFALFHGWAHGAGASPGGFWWFSAGFTLVSGLLLLAGFAARRYVERTQLAAPARSTAR